MIATQNSLVLYPCLYCDASWLIGFAWASGTTCPPCLETDEGESSGDGSCSGDLDQRPAALPGRRLDEQHDRLCRRRGEVDGREPRPAGRRPVRDGRVELPREARDAGDEGV